MTAPAARQRVVHQAAERLRDLVFAQPPGTQIGSLPDLARQLGVGIVTVQQAARILEHEGLLQVRRGPGGGYYGLRPDDAAFERAIGAYMRMHPTSYEEALDMTSLLFNELVPAAARCTDPALRDELVKLAEGIDACDDETRLASFETRFQELLFRMVDRPLFEVLTRVTLRFAERLPAGGRVFDDGGGDLWKAGRHRIIAAILNHDEQLARFEADRSNRQVILRALAGRPR